MSGIERSSGSRPEAGSLLPEPRTRSWSPCTAWLVVVEQGCRVARASYRRPSRVHRDGREELGESAGVDPYVPPVGDHRSPVCPGGGRSRCAQRVMHAAQGDDVVTVRGAALLPRPHVMQVAVAHRRRTSRERTATVAQTDRSSKARRGQSHSKSHVQDWESLPSTAGMISALHARTRSSPAETDVPSASTPAARPGREGPGMGSALGAAPRPRGSAASSPHRAPGPPRRRESR